MGVVTCEEKKSVAIYVRPCFKIILKSIAVNPGATALILQVEKANSAGWVDTETCRIRFFNLYLTARGQDEFMK